jgi:hypothetical protein
MRGRKRRRIVWQAYESNATILKQDNHKGNKSLYTSLITIAHHIMLIAIDQLARDFSWEWSAEFIPTDFILF